MTNNIWHDNIDSNFPEIAGLVDNTKTIIQHNGKYAYLGDLLALESKLEIAIKAFKDILENSVEDNTIDVSYVALRKIGEIE